MWTLSSSTAYLLGLVMMIQSFLVVNAQTVQIIDGTTKVTPSTESTYDHMVVLEDNLSFHWNDVLGDTYSARLIQTADSMDQAPSWLGFGIYHSNHNYTILPTQNLMIGSTALIGIVTTAETPTPAQHYHLASQMVDGIRPVSDDTSYSNANVAQHNSDDGKVTTDLTFSKQLFGDTPAGGVRKDGTNVFLWAVGPPGASLGSLGKHSLKGALYLDFNAVKKKTEGSSTLQQTNPTAGGGTDGAARQGQDAVNTAPIITGQCGSSLLAGGDAGQISLTPMLNFHWKLVGGGSKVQIALEYTGREAWLGVALSLTGFMVGSSAIIGSPGNDALATPPTHYNLNDQTPSGVVADASVILEDASVEMNSSDDNPSEITTVLKFTKLVDDPNDSIPITSGYTTFLYAVGDSRELAYHEHRGAFQIDLEDCGGSIRAGGIWTHHGYFASHGFLATLAWALTAPFAVTVAWFRTLVPASWIYIHVFANVFTFSATLLAFFIVIMGVSKEDQAEHFRRTHHWVGLLLMFVATFQVVNGFLRPPVQRKDPNRPDPPQDSFLGIIPIPRTPRETWVLMHRMSGLLGIALGIYQIQSGLTLYADRFQTVSMVSYYWLYVGLFFFSLFALKGWVWYEEDKARRGVLQAVSTTEPQEEHDASPAPAVEGTMS